MKNYLFHLFIFLPLSFLSSMPVAVIISLVLTYINGMLDFSIWILLVISAILVAFWFLFWFIDCKIRDLDTGAYKALNFLLIPLKFPLQLIGCFFAFIGIFTDKICAYRKVETFNGGLAIFTSMLFNFYFDIDSSYGENGRNGEFNIKSKNIIMQMFVLTPITIGMSIAWYFFFKLLTSRNKEIKQIIFMVICLIIVFILSIILTKIKGHETHELGWDPIFRFKNEKPTGIEKKFIHGEDGWAWLDEEGNISTTGFIEGYDSKVADYKMKGFKKERGGWRPELRLVSIFGLMMSPILSVFQVVSLLIAIFSNPYNGKLISWYGEPSCFKQDITTWQQVVHYLLNFVII